MEYKQFYKTKLYTLNLVDTKGFQYNQKNRELLAIYFQIIQVFNVLQIYVNPKYRFLYDIDALLILFSKRYPLNIIITVLILFEKIIDF